jgi:hypothetical protein
MSDKIENLTLKQLLSALTPGQAWAALGVLVTLVGGSFGAGYTVADHMRQAELSAKDLKAAQAEAKVEGAEATARDKEQALAKAEDASRFLALYLRLELARAANAPQDEFNAKRDALDQFIGELVKDKRARLHKGAGEKTFVTFPDGTSWPLPSGSHMALES